MTGPETIDLKQMKAEILAVLRDEVRSELVALRDDVTPAMRLAANFERAGDIAIGAARVMKWGAAVGSGVVVIFAGLRALGIV